MWTVVHERFDSAIPLTRVALATTFLSSVIIILSPIYADLTSSISSDTILNLATLSFVTRLLFYDYDKGSYTAVSLNSAVFGAIILSSRLQTSFAATILVISALLMFRSSRCQFPVAFYAFYLVQTLARGDLHQAAFSLILQFIFCILGPFLLRDKYFLRDKNRIYGIWDEAEMDLT